MMLISSCEDFCDVAIVLLNCAIVFSLLLLVLLLLVNSVLF